MNEQSLTRIVSNKRMPLRQTHFIWLCLNDAESTPEFVSKNGCFWFNDDSFILNSKIFSNFVDKKNNTVLKDLLSHGFKSQILCRKIKEKIPDKFNFHMLPDQRGWRLYRCEGFTKNTPEVEVVNWKRQKH